MSSVVSIRCLLVANAALIAVVPALQVFAGDVPLNSVLPAIGITDVAGVPRNTVSMKETARTLTARVQVTVYAKTYPTQKSILELVRKAVPNTHGMVGSVKVLSVLPSTVSPDMKNDAATIFMQSRDFKITYIEP